MAGQAIASASDASELRFEPIDLARHKELCLEFKIDTFVVSFGNAERFYGPHREGIDLYLKQLEGRLLDDRACCVHVWLGGEIIGQIEAVIRELSSGEVGGYVSLYYLVPAHRGKGFGEDLDAYATTFFKRHGLEVAHLNVSPSNERAVRLYERCGWRNFGERRESEVQLMEKRF